LVDKIFVFATIIGAACIIMGLFMVNNTITLVNTSQKTTATVVSFNVRDSVYYPIFSFTDASGSTMTAQGIGGGETNRTYRIGQKVPIIYDATNPAETVRVNTLLSIWLGPMFLTIMGGFDTTLSLVLYWRRRPRVGSMLMI